MCECDESRYAVKLMQYSASACCQSLQHVLYDTALVVVVRLNIDRQGREDGCSGDDVSVVMMVDIIKSVNILYISAVMLAGRGSALCVCVCVL